MKISIIGAGVQGSTIAYFSAKSPEVSEIVCSDVSLDRVRVLAEKIGSDKISIQRVDAADVDELLKVTNGADAVINATLPKFNLRIMDAALRSGAHYVDLAADNPVRVHVLKELGLSPKWKDAGLTAVINQGGPFVMNVLVRYAADQLDKVSSIRLRFGWRAVSEEKEVIPTWRPIWCPDIALAEWSSEPVIYDHGKFREVPQFSGVEEYRFPDPVGPVNLCFIEYEPVLTLPQFIGKGVKYVDCKLTLDYLTATLVKMGFANDKPIMVKGVKVSPRDVLLALVPHPAEEADRIETGKMDSLGCYVAEVEGEKEGRKMIHTLYRSYSFREVNKRLGATWAEVAIPAVTTAVMLANGEIKIKGVVPPEALEPKPFLAKLAENGITFQERITEYSQV